MVHLLRSNALIRHVTIRVDLADDLPLVYGDRVQLQQVLMNLILNGFEAMADEMIENRTITREGVAFPLRPKTNQHCPKVP